MRTLLLLSLVACGEPATVSITVDRIEPAMGAVTGEVPVLIEGSFAGGGTLTVTLDNIPLIEIDLFDEATIDAVVPAGIAVGSYDLTVTLGSASDVLPAAYIAVAP